MRRNRTRIKNSERNAAAAGVVIGNPKATDCVRAIRAAGNHIIMRYCYELILFTHNNNGIGILRTGMTL